MWPRTAHRSIFLHFKMRRGSSTFKLKSKYIDNIIITIKYRHSLHLERIYYNFIPDDKINLLDKYDWAAVAIIELAYVGEFERMIFTTDKLTV